MLENWFKSVRIYLIVYFLVFIFKVVYFWELEYDLNLIRLKKFWIGKIMYKNYVDEGGEL